MVTPEATASQTPQKVASSSRRIDRTLEIVARDHPSILSLFQRVKTRSTTRSQAIKAFCQELREEMTRISRLVGDFQQLEQARARAAEQARNAELLRLEREKAEAIAKANSHEQVDAIQQHYNRQAETLPAPIGSAL